MTRISDNKEFATGKRIVTANYAGPDRRDRNGASDEVRITSKLIRDARGSQVLEVRSEADRRRCSDDTVNLLKILEIDGLTLAD